MGISTFLNLKISYSEFLLVSADSHGTPFKEGVRMGRNEDIIHIHAPFIIEGKLSQNFPRTLVNLHCSEPGQSATPSCHWS